MLTIRLRFAWHFVDDGVLDIQVNSSLLVLPEFHFWRFMFRWTNRISSYVNLLQSKWKYKLGSFRHFIVVDQVTAQVQCKFPTNIQADTVTSLVHALAIFVLGLEKHREKIFFILFTDTYSVVCHFNFDTDELARILYDKFINWNFNYVSMCWEFNRILDQIYQDLLDSQLVDHDIICAIGSLLQPYILQPHTNSFSLQVKHVDSGLDNIL